MAAQKKPWIDDATWLPRFCAAYLKNFRVVEACEAVGCSSASGYRYIHEDVVQAQLRDMTKPAIDASYITVERILCELANSAFFDIASVTEKSNGRIIDNVHDIPEAARRAITEIEQRTEKYEVNADRLPVVFTLDGEMAVRLQDLIDGDPEVVFDSKGQMVFQLSSRVLRTRIKMMSKERCLELLGKYREIAMFKEVVETQGEDSVARVRVSSLEERVAALQKDRKDVMAEKA